MPARIITNGLSKASKPNMNSATNASAKKIRVCTHTGCAAMRFKVLRSTYHPPPAPDGTFPGSREQTRAYHTFSTQLRTTGVLASLRPLDRGHLTLTRLLPANRRPRPVRQVTRFVKARVKR